MITFSTKGDFKKLTNFLKKEEKLFSKVDLKKYGELCIKSLRDATPKDTGKTADSWRYSIQRNPGVISLVFNNDNIQNGIPVVILLRYGHATRSGTFVTGNDFVTPAVSKIFEQAAIDIWEEVKDNE